MQSALARVLLTKGVIRQGTVVEAYHHVRGLSCERTSRVVASFIIARASLLNGVDVVFDAIGPKQLICRLASEQIISLDGMLIERIASSHHLTLDGSVELAIIRPRRRRYRKRIPVPVHASEVAK
jgi:hypothetical protein